MAEYSLPAYLGIPKVDLLELLYRMLDKLSDNARGFYEKIFGIGLGIGGHINPELIILRGQVIDGNRFLFESIERVVMNQCLRHIAKSLRILYSEDRTDIRFMGINSMILVEYFTQ